MGKLVVGGTRFLLLCSLLLALPSLAASQPTPPAPPSLPPPPPSLPPSLPPSPSQPTPTPPPTAPQPVPVSTPTMVTLSFNPKSIIAGKSTTLSWSSTNATACTASGDWSGSKQISGSQNITIARNAPGTTTYTLSCSGSGGTGSASATLTASAIYNTGFPNQIITATVRDFRTSHPDFEKGISGLVKGLVGSSLPSDKKPVFVASPGAGAITNASTFAQWYTDVPGVNQSTTLPLTLTETAPGSGIFDLNVPNFFPIDNKLFGNEGLPHNYHFTLELHTTFTYQRGQVFQFTGDDDLWVYINNKLAVDLGGVKDAVSASVALDTLNLTPGNTYDLDLYFTERHTVSSVFHIQTSIAFNAPNLVVLVHGCCTDENDVITDWEPFGMLIEAKIKQSQTPEAWDIVVWDWSHDTPKASVNPFEDAYRNAVNQGNMLANAIANDNYNHVHLIGHSAGSNLIDTVSGVLLAKSAQTGRKPFIHLTFLDAYTPHLDEISYGANANYAEHYVDRTDAGVCPIVFSSTNAILSHAFNYDVTACPSDAPQIKPDEKTKDCGHQWPRYWYQKSVTTTPRFKNGYPLSREGGNSQISNLSGMVGTIILQGTDCR